MLLARRITPACAGNSYLDFLPTKVRQDHPRLRGEQKRCISSMDGSGGSPPLARGTAIGLAAIIATGGITPACAGNSRRRCRMGAEPWDHPRLRGEQPAVVRKDFIAQGSPPLARGTVGEEALDALGAGNRNGNTTIANEIGDHPRLRGEQSSLAAE